MWIAIIAMIIGLAVLVWSADTFIDGATQVAVKFNMPSFLIGVLILGVGTSAPEMVVSALSAMAGSPDLALGNAYGSNILNIALVLGITALISPIVVQPNVVKQDLILLLGITALAGWQLSDGELSRLDGIILLVTLVLVLGLQTFLSLRQNKQDLLNTDEPLPDQSEIHMGKAVFSLIFGLALLIASSRAVVWGAVELATLWGLSQLIIGLTIVAVGTSLPELVASIIAARRGEHDMVLGNIIGSNMFNTLAVVGLAVVIHPMQVEPIIFSRDIMVVAGITLLLTILCIIALKRGGKFGRISGAILLMIFIGYTFWLVQSVKVGLTDSAIASVY